MAKKVAKRKPKLPKVLIPDERYLLQAADLTYREARLLYKLYERTRIFHQGQIQTIKWLKKHRQPVPEIFDQFRLAGGRLRERLKAALAVYVDQQVPTRWMQAVGLGIPQAVGIYTMIDIRKCHEVSGLWRYAGYDPTQRRLTRKEAYEVTEYFKAKYSIEYPNEETVRRIALELNRGPDTLLSLVRLYQGRKKNCTWTQVRRVLLSVPWRFALKEILYRVGIVFRRGRGRMISPYRSIYDLRKAYEIAKNDRFEYADQAAHVLATRNFKPETKSFGILSQGKLTPAHIDARVRRWTVKIFLTHLHQVLFYERYGRLPAAPYIIDVMGRDHEISCPMWPYRVD